VSKYGISQDVGPLLDHRVSYSELKYANAIGVNRVTWRAFTVKLTTPTQAAVNSVALLSLAITSSQCDCRLKQLYLTNRLSQAHGTQRTA